MDTMEIVGLVIVITHVIVMASFILWFGFGSPKTMAQFRAKLKEQMRAARGAVPNFRNEQ